MKDSQTIISHNHFQFQELPMTENEKEVAQLPVSSRLGTWKTNMNGAVQHIPQPHKNRADNLVHSDRGICWLNPPDQAWSPSFYLSERGLDNIHIYFWITKDLCWVQSWLLPGLIIGSLACLYALFLTFRAAYWRRNLGEFWIKLAEFMWLFANFWWMIGEVHDDHYGFFGDGENSIVDKHTKEAGVMFICTLVWISLYYIILKPMNLLEETKEEQLKTANDPTMLQPRFSFFFKTWNEYENIHIFFWVGKDTAWNWWIQSMWLVFFIPTLLIGLDFVYLTLRSKRLMIDHGHYFAQFMWVLANAVWAGGEFWFTPNNDSAIPLSRFSSEARHTARWYSGWVVLGAYLPLLVLYTLWLYYTFWGVIPPVGRKNTRAGGGGGGAGTGTVTGAGTDSSGLGRDHMCESGDFDYDSQQSSTILSELSGLSGLVVNPLVPVRQVSVQPPSSPPSPSTSTSFASSKASFKISSSAVNKIHKQPYDPNNPNGDSDSDSEYGGGGHELRMSDLSESNSVIHGAEI
jgi:hypothetical protein